MAQNIFDATFDQNNSINVNSFDWSHVNNLTTNFGRITPVFCELVPAKGSLRINPEFGLELMPMVFPVQTRMFARLNFFKVTLRSLWEDYTDFIGNFRNDIEEPYIVPNNVTMKDMLTTGSLGDYLGIPTRTTPVPVSVKGIMKICNDSASTPTTIVSWQDYNLSLNQIRLNSPTLTGESCAQTIQNTSSVSVYTLVFKTSPTTQNIPSNAGSVKLSFSIGSTSKDVLNQLVGKYGRLVLYSNGPVYESDFQVELSLNADGTAVVADTELINLIDYPALLDKPLSAWLVLPWSKSEGMLSFSTLKWDVTATTYGGQQEITSLDNFPFASAFYTNRKRLLAYRFRAYEAVYNAYYRDIRNNPFIVDGKPVYNRWLPTMKGGADTTPYKLHQCNWEKDFLTTAVPNPQQGANAPLVGLVVGDVVTKNADGSLSVKKQSVLVDEDGQKYGVTYQANEDNTALVGVEYEPLSDKTPVTQINSYSELAALATEQGSGFTIETLRYVNAYQKFLELNMRKGFSYKQIMQGRWDINIKFNELLMPEFIGGVSRELNMRTVEQTIDQQTETTQGQYAQALGSKTGIAGVYGYGDNNVEVFCDEESYIIGLLTVTPVPVYSQLLAKDWTYEGLLDHYQPEFDRIGFQPITYKELCPMNAVGNLEQLEQVFGYQRPWYEYVAKYDSAHGLFRTELKNFIMQRTFNGLPELGQQFLLVDPETTNQVFAVTEFTDKIFGYVKFNATARLPISRVAIPRLD